MPALPPLRFRWSGDSFVPFSPYVQGECDKHFVVGELYRLEVREERSTASHGHYHAVIAEAWDNLPEDQQARWPTP